MPRVALAPMSRRGAQHSYRPRETAWVQGVVANAACAQPGDRPARAALLVGHEDRANWTCLWRVSAGLRREDDPSPAHVDDLAARLAGPAPLYADQRVDGVLVLRVVDATGQAASSE